MPYTVWSFAIFDTDRIHQLRNSMLNKIIPNFHQMPNKTSHITIFCALSPLIPHVWQRTISESLWKVQKDDPQLNSPQLEKVLHLAAEQTNKFSAVQKRKLWSNCLMQSGIQRAKEVSNEEMQESIPEGEIREYTLKEFIHYILLQSIMYVCKPWSYNVQFGHKHFGNMEKYQYSVCITATIICCIDWTAAMKPVTLDEAFSMTKISMQYS